MMNISIKRVAVEDVEQLQVISKQTFYESFSSGNTEENMKKYLENGFSIEKLTGELSTDDSEFYFALVDAIKIGYLKINFGESQTKVKEDASLEIERIYVLKNFQGKKVGQMLYEKAISIARQKNISYVWLGVWEENPRAIKFYERNGFREFDKRIFKLGDDEQRDIMMKLQIN